MTNGVAERAIERVVIVGGGTAGWMAAAALSAHLAGTGAAITLIESSDIGTVGVGEATIPTIRRFYAQLGMSDVEVMQTCDATAKLGIRFVDWLRPGHDFVHPFGRFGQDLKGVDFHHYWLKARAAGDTPARSSAFSIGRCISMLPYSRSTCAVSPRNRASRVSMRALPTSNCVQMTALSRRWRSIAAWRSPATCSSIARVFEAC
jgi:hypothetical protein